MSLEQHIYQFLRRLAKQAKTLGVIAGAIFILLWVLLPPTPALTTFGKPTIAEQVDTPAEILSYLLRYNERLVRTMEVLRWTLAVLGGLVLASSGWLWKEVAAWSRTMDAVLKVRAQPDPSSLPGVPADQQG
ncbi:MAG TPA: hypothetical protein VKF62_00745 [Planctomycetota bacterium]|nr:hypothetical protein [Planctomycetota bacterium]